MSFSFFNAYKPSLHLKLQKDLKDKNDIRQKLYKVSGPGTKKSSLAEMMDGKRASTKKK